MIVDNDYVGLSQRCDKCKHWQDVSSVYCNQCGAELSTRYVSGEELMQEYETVRKNR